LGGKHTHRREHRTEVTEATERGFWGRWSERALGGRRRFWAGNGRVGESIAQRSQRSQRGILRAMVEQALGGRRRFWAGNTRFGDSIAQRSQRPQRGILGAMVRAGFGRTSSLLGGKRTRRREHRTEVTEATERGFWGDGPSGLWAVVVAFGRETHAPERASHRGHRGHRGDFRGDGPSGLWVVVVAFGRETRVSERASHRGQSGDSTQPTTTSPSSASRKTGNYNFR
jgi:hypothetical protein